MKIKLKSHFTAILLGIILLCGLFFRVYDLNNTVTWYGDSSRDVLVAKHLIEGEIVFVRPDASGGRRQILNSPLYFILISIFWFITHSPLLISYIFALFGVLSIVLAFLLGKEIKNNETGIYAASFISFSNLFIAQSRAIWQTHLITFFLLLALLFVVRLYKRKSIQDAFIALTLAFFTLHLHLAFLPIFLVLLFLIIRGFTKCAHKGNFVKILFFTYTLGLSVLWYFATKPQYQSDNFFVTELVHFSPRNYFWALAQMGLTFETTLFPYSNIFLVSVLLGIAVSGILLLQRKNKDDSNVNLLASLLSSFFLVPLYSARTIPFHYLQAYFVLLIVMMATLIANVKVKFLKISLFLIVVICLGQGSISFLQKKQSNELQIYNEVSAAIYKDAQLSGNTKIRVEQYQNECNCSDWNTSQLYYSIEKFSGEKLVELSQYKNSFSPIYETGPVYVVCEVDYRDECLSHSSLATQEVTLVKNFQFSAAYTFDIFKGKTN